MAANQNSCSMVTNFCRTVTQAEMEAGLLFELTRCWVCLLLLRVPIELHSRLAPLRLFPSSSLFHHSFLLLHTSYFHTLLILPLLLLLRTYSHSFDHTSTTQQFRTELCHCLLKRTSLQHEALRVLQLARHHDWSFRCCAASAIQVSRLSCYL